MSLLFDGAGDYVDDPSGFDIGAEDVSVTAWVRVVAFNCTTFAAAPAFFGGTIFSTRFLSFPVGADRSPTLCYSPRLGGVDSGVKRLIFAHDTNFVAIGARGATNLITDTVYHMAGTFKADATVPSFGGYWNCFLNGVMDNPAANNYPEIGGIMTPHIGFPWQVAHNNPWPQTPPEAPETGHMELWDVRVYFRALSPEEIQTIYYARGHDGIVDSLVRRWLFNESTIGAGAIAGGVKDAGPMQGATLTLGSTPSYEGDRISKRRKLA